MIFLVKALALQNYYKCDNFLVTGNNLEEKKKETAKDINTTNVNEYKKYSPKTGKEHECFIRKRALQKNKNSLPGTSAVPTTKKIYSYKQEDNNTDYSLQLLCLRDIYQSYEKT